MSAPSGVSHIAVVTGDLDGFRAFYEDTIGLRTTIVFGGGPGHSRQAILMAGDAMLHVFEVADDHTATHGDDCRDVRTGPARPPGFHRDRPGGAERRFAIDCSQSMPPAATSIPWDRCSPLRFVDPDGLEGEINCYNPEFDPINLRDEDEVVDPDWLSPTKRALQSGAGPDRRQPSGAAQLSREPPGGQADDHHAARFDRPDRSATRRRRAILGVGAAALLLIGDGCVRQRERRCPDIGRCNDRGERGTDHSIDSCFDHICRRHRQFNSGSDAGSGLKTIDQGALQALVDSSIKEQLIPGAVVVLQHTAGRLHRRVRHHRTRGAEPAGRGHPFPDRLEHQDDDRRRWSCNWPRRASSH